MFGFGSEEIVLEKIVIHGGHRLSGKIKVDGAKNAILPLIAASILASKGEINIIDVPLLEDVKIIVSLLKSLGIKAELGDGRLSICASNVRSTEAPYHLVSKMRASFIIMGPLLARQKHARVPIPGGCAIGVRPIDLHLKGLEALGAKFEFKQGFVEGTAPNGLTGATVYLDFPSVGATQNIMMAAALAKGRTVIENAACEPEIIDLANFINAMGGQVKGSGTGEIRIQGVDFLSGTEYMVIPDRIEAGTYMMAAAITRGRLLIEGALPEHLVSLIAKLREMGVETAEANNGIYVNAMKPLSPINVKTLPYPAFPTDLQAQMIALQSTVPGVNLMTESIFENRFMHVEELRRMGANIRIDGRTAVIEGVDRLSGANVKATDLRSGAALILAGLSAQGVTEVTELHHVYRGYVNIVEKLRGAGAHIECVREEDELLLINENAG